MTHSQEQRPGIKTISTAKQLKRWYWLKSELVEHARALGLRTSGGKFDILDRVAHYLETGETERLEDQKPKPTSKFDWHSADLNLETVITDSYKNSQNVRRFFKQHLGDSFTFNTRFMAWMRGNAGKTLGDAVAAYNAQQNEEKKQGFVSEIAHHNQFNQYTRDFLSDNPELGMKDVRHYWALKRKQPSETGRHVYQRSDLELDR